MTPFLIPARAAGGYLPLSASSRRHLLQGLIVASVLHLVAAAALRGSIDREDANRPPLIELPTELVPGNQLVYEILSGEEPVTPTPPPPPRPVVAEPVVAEQGMPVMVEEREAAPDTEPSPAGPSSASDMPGNEATPGPPGPGSTVAGSSGVVQDEAPHFVASETLPVAVTKVVPRYPSGARVARLEGKVWVHMRVAEDGRVTRALIAESEADVFNEAALEAARQWVFTPALMQQQPVAVWIVIEFRFSLRDAR